MNYIAGAEKPGLSFNPALIHYGRNSGYQAINLAVHFGVKRILLLGFDMKSAEDGRRHWFGDHPWDIGKRPVPDERQKRTYALFMENFATLPPDLRRAGVEVINCTQDSALECFPRMSLEAALA